jgi:hypothetical protein
VPKATDCSGYQQIIRPNREMGAGLKSLDASEPCCRETRIPRIFSRRVPLYSPLLASEEWLLDQIGAVRDILLERKVDNMGRLAASGAVDGIYRSGHAPAKRDDEDACETEGVTCWPRAPLA